MKTEESNKVQIFSCVSYYDGLSKTKQRALERTLNEAVREAMNDETFRKVQRLSYGQHGPEEVGGEIVVIDKLVKKIFF